MEWLVHLFFLPFVLTLMFFNWLEEKFITIKNREKLEDGEHLIHHRKYKKRFLFYRKAKTLSQISQSALLSLTLYLQLGNLYLGIV
jgi:hypothetical protein